MGLDGVEIIMSVEEQFGIQIFDDETEKITTPGLLIDLICSKLRSLTNPACPSQHSFYLIRRSLMRHLNIKRNHIKPTTELMTLFPDEKKRQEQWQNVLCDVIGTSAERFELGRSELISMTVLLIIPFIVLVISIPLLSIWLAPVCAFMSVILGALLTTSFKVKFPRGYRNVKDIVQRISCVNAKSWTRSEVKAHVTRILIETLGVEEKQITENARLVEDLGLC